MSYRRRRGGDAPERPSGATAEDEVAAAVEAARTLARAFAQASEYVNPDLLVGDPDFEETAARLAADTVPEATLLKLARDSLDFLACIALAAIERRGGLPAAVPQILKRLGRRGGGEVFFLLRALAASAGDTPVIPRVLACVQPWWVAGPLRESLVAFLEQRIAAGEEPTADGLAEHVPVAAEEAVAELVDELDGRAGEVLRPAVSRWRLALVDADFFREFGRVVEAAPLEPMAELASRRAALDAVERALTTAPRRSVLVVGEQGVGKTVVLREALQRLLGEGWFAFEASASDVNAGQSYVGQLEGRVQEIGQRTNGRNVVWLFPRLEEGFWSGQHNRSPQGLLDKLLPYLESGQVVLLAEIEPLAYELILRLRPRIASVFDVVRLPQLTEEEALSVGTAWADAHPEIEISAATLAEAYDLASHYFPATAAPGNLVRLLTAVFERAVERGTRTVETGDVVDALSEESGLPLHVLDPRAPLDLDEVRAVFGGRVLGQPEAVECLVERVALIKAGLTDPTRPLGVFLFVGPTGTGKTEIAKALAEFLFGSADRLVRLDMSEFQTPESLERLLSDTAVSDEGSALISTVRKQPFSVLLLDEFEKAHRKVWDVFLQVFDDGRLTDRGGVTTDFRHCIVILTSNVGSAIPRGPGLGFASAGRGFDPAGVERAVVGTFRPELLNRLDRIVVFRPLDREVMRRLVELELRTVLGRRGFRIHPWAVEWDDAAVDFLLEQGFTAELGARPLKRAVERHVLVPLALAIVGRRFPEGDQFLLIGVGPTGIEVTFVDPDADDTAATDAAAAEGTLASLVLDPDGSPASIELVRAEFERISAEIESDWSSRKAQLLDETREPGFWDRPDRFDTLALVEYLDRLDAAQRTAGNLYARVPGSNGSAAKLVQLLAARLWVLDRALAGLADGDPSDCVVTISASGGPATHAFAADLQEMYRGWAHRRLMRVRDDEGNVRSITVSGLGAYTILKHESGLHVLELPTRDRSFERVTVQVSVVGAEPGGRPTAEPARRPKIVRRYRRAPSPLVRDARGWRTGRIDRVLGGDFDVVT
jgi:ATP-dependent Clp protease ATP-binding subunit ClpC